MAMEQYTKLLEQLKSLVDTIGQYITQRDTFTSHANSLHQTRAKLADRILNSNGGDTGELVKELEQIEREQRLGGAKYDALMARCEASEQELHELLPKATPPFARLQYAVYNRVVELEQALAMQRVSAARHHEVLAASLTIAQCSSAVQEIQALTIPDGSSFLTTRPFADVGSSTGAPRWSRSEVVAALLEVCSKLIDSSEKLLARVNSLGESFVVPPFFLGEPEQPATTTTSPGFEKCLEWSMPLGGSERELAERICKEGGRDINNLNDHDKLILAHTLKNYRVIHGRDVPLTEANP